MDFDLSLILHGFDLDLIGFDCSRELGHDDLWRCPFQPGCGKAPGPECPLMQQWARTMANMIRPPPRWQ